MTHFFPWYLGGPPRAALTAFVTLDPSAQAKIKEAIRELEFPYRRKKLSEKAQQLHQELRVLDTDTLLAIIDSLTDLVEIPRESLPEFLAELFRDTAIPHSNLESIINEISSDPKFAEQRAIEAFKNLALPRLGRVEQYCAIRSRFDKQFKYSEDNIESYSPQVVDYHPVVIVKAEVESPKRNLTFQLDEERLDKLISELIAAQRQLKVLADRWTASRGESNVK